MHPIPSAPSFVVGALLLVGLLTNGAPAAAQRATPAPRPSVAAPAPVRYTLRIDAADTTVVHVEMRIAGARDTTRLVMVLHPEYDDRWWRYMEDVRAERGASSGRAAASVVREDSARWRVVAPRMAAARGNSDTLIVRWRVRMPPAEEGVRAAWRPFLTPTGALVGGPHFFPYVLGGERAPAEVMLRLPDEWRVATALTPVAGFTRRFRAANVTELVESPMLVGPLREWTFDAGGAPHRIAYWPRPDATPFDTVQFVRDISGLAREAIALFSSSTPGQAPYRDYTYLLQDGAYGGLEHRASVTVGAPSEGLASGDTEIMGDIAHEYVHLWNLMRIRPSERRTTVSHLKAPSSRGLWFSEGLTMYYADALLRRAGIATSDSTRVSHLERQMVRYLENPGDTEISPERASLAEYAGAPGTLGDYDPSPHLQGELIGAMLDLRIRGATSGRRSMDDVMRAMLVRHGDGTGGFTGRDVEREVERACGCDVTPFFDRHVRGAAVLDFDRYLRVVGMRAVVTRTPATDDDGRAVADVRVRVWNDPGDELPRLMLMHPDGAWARAGLHTNDRVFAVNRTRITSARSFYSLVRQAKLGDTLVVDIVKGMPDDTQSAVKRAHVVLGGFERVRVRLEALPDATPTQRRLRARWLAARP